MRFLPFALMILSDGARDEIQQLDSSRYNKKRKNDSNDNSGTRKRGYTYFSTTENKI